MADPGVKQIEPLSAGQIAQFKRDGFLVLPAVLDLELCRQVRDEMWETIQTHFPRMKRDDPTTWGHITEEESDRFKARRPEATPTSTGGDIGSRYVTALKT